MHCIRFPTAKELQESHPYVTWLSEAMEIQYIQDYMDNNRIVVNKNGTVEQVTQYYPYGGVIRDISTLLSDVTKGNNENVQKYKFEGPRSHQKEIDNLLARRRAFRRGVELDRTFGLDNYDIHARQYFAMAPMWDKIDPLAEKSPGISPYAYCGGDPVNIVDYDGKAIIFVNGFRIGVGCRDQVRYGYGDNSYPSVYKEDKAKYWDNNIVHYYKVQFDDNNTLFTSGSASPVSTAAQREEEGGVKALILDIKVSEGAIALDKDEPIRIVSHSQGGATAAGMAKTLLEYGYNVEIVEYITPHQATDFTHPDGVEGIQYDQKYDRVVSGQGAIEGVEHRFVDPSHFRSLLGGHANSDNKEIIKRVKK